MVNGIEGKIMINRTAEYARQMADRINQTENAKDFAAQIEKQRAVHDSHSVNETEHSEQKVVRRDQGSKGGKGGGQGDPESREETLMQEDTPTVMPSETLGKEIDIIV